MDPCRKFRLIVCIAIVLLIAGAGSAVAFQACADFGPGVGILQAEFAQAGSFFSAHGRFIFQSLPISATGTGFLESATSFRLGVLGVANSPTLTDIIFNTQVDLATGTGSFTGLQVRSGTVFSGNVAVVPCPSAGESLQAEHAAKGSPSPLPGSAWEN